MASAIAMPTSSVAIGWMHESATLRLRSFTVLLKRKEPFDQRVVPLIAAILQLAKSQKQVNDELQKHRGTIKDLSSINVAKATA